MEQFLSPHHKPVWYDHANISSSSPLPRTVLNGTLLHSSLLGKGEISLGEMQSKLDCRWPGGP